MPLKEWDVEIYRGVLTGCNDAFIITSEKRDEILANCIDEDERVRTAELIRPNMRSYVDCMQYLLDLLVALSYPSIYQGVVLLQGSLRYEYVQGHL